MKDELESSGNTLREFQQSPITRICLCSVWLAIVCLIAIVSVGVAVYRKFRHLEKSHLL